MTDDGQWVDPAINDVLASVYDPCCRDKGISVVDLGLVRAGRIADGMAAVQLVLTSGWCPFASRVLTDVETAVRDLPGVEDATVEIVWDDVWGPERLSDSARDKLRFLPDPATAGDPAAYVAAHWPARRGAAE